jgi:hypothetical protein
MPPAYFVGEVGTLPPFLRRRGSERLFFLLLLLRLEGRGRAAVGNGFCLCLVFPGGDSTDCDYGGWNVTGLARETKREDNVGGP